MKSWIWAIVLIGLVILISALGFGKNANLDTKISDKEQSVQVADKIIVANFFRTQRCATCLAIGNLTKKTLTEKFAKELESGRIEFKEINVDLPENKEMARKYKASGSSLFINAVVDEKDNIVEDTTVWRLFSNENQYISYLENKLNKHLGK